MFGPVEALFLLSTDADDEEYDDDDDDGNH